MRFAVPAAGIVLAAGVIAAAGTTNWWQSSAMSHVPDLPESELSEISMPADMLYTRIIRILAASIGLQPGVGGTMGGGLGGGMWGSWLDVSTLRQFRMQLWVGPGMPGWQAGAALPGWTDGGLQGRDLAQAMRKWEQVWEQVYAGNQDALYISPGALSSLDIERRALGAALASDGLTEANASRLRAYYERVAAALQRRTVADERSRQR